MKPDATDITVVLDRSGSMEIIKDDTQGGFDHFVAEQAKLPGECRLTLVQFDTEYEFVHRGVPIAEVPKLLLVPRGNTALLDAIGRAINETGKRLSDLPEEQRPAHVIFAIVTDGQENSSREFSLAKIKEMIQHQTDVYNWRFTYLGANQDAIAEAAKMGIDKGHAMHYAHTGRGAAAAFGGAAKAVVRARSNQTMDYTDEERQKADES